MRQRIRVKPARGLVVLVIGLLGWRCLLVSPTLLFVRRQDMNNRRLISHQLKHAEQMQRHGCARFIVLYCWWSLKYGSQSNPFEIEAVHAEKERGYIRWY